MFGKFNLFFFLSITKFTKAELRKAQSQNSELCSSTFSQTRPCNPAKMNPAVDKSGHVQVLLSDRQWPDTELFRSSSHELDTLEAITAKDIANDKTQPTKQALITMAFSCNAAISTLWLPLKCAQNEKFFQTDYKGQRERRTRKWNWKKISIWDVVK